MRLTVEQIGPLELIGLRYDLPRGDKPFSGVPALWKQADELGLGEALAIRGTRRPYGPLGVSEVTPDGAVYWLAASVAPGDSDTAALEGFGQPVERLSLPGPAWAVIEAVGPLNATPMSELQRALATFEEIVAQAGLTRAPGPIIEECDDGDVTAPGYHSWLWVPVESPQAT